MVCLTDTYGCLCLDGTGNVCILSGGSQAQIDLCDAAADYLQLGDGEISMYDNAGDTMALYQGSVCLADCTGDQLLLNNYAACWRM